MPYLLFLAGKVIGAKRSRFEGYLVEGESAKFCSVNENKILAHRFDDKESAEIWGEAWMNSKTVAFKPKDFKIEQVKK